MIGSLELRCVAAQPQKPLQPIFSFQGSPQSLRLLDVPKQIGNWNITKVKVSVLYPDNITREKEATRTGNVWVCTFEGCSTAGKVTQGLTILADGVDENNNEVTGYCLGKADVFVLEDDSDIARLVGKSTMRYLDDIPATPSKGDTIVVNGALKIYDGTEWFSFDLRDYYNKEQIDAMVEPLDSSISVLTASVSTLSQDIGVVSASVSALSSSMTSLASTKRDYTDKTWKYTWNTDTEMYGIQSFNVANDTLGGNYQLKDFDSTNKVWSVYEGTVEVKAYSYTTFAVIDENNPHQFDDDGILRDGWPFYRLSDTNTQWLVAGGDVEYTVIASRRADTSLALANEVEEKRDYEDLSWKYPMDKDPVRFGVQSFEVTWSGSLYRLSQFTSASAERKWYQADLGAANRFEITATSARHFTLKDKVTAQTTTFTRTDDTNTSWELQNGQDIYIVLASKRKPATLAIYEPDTENTDEVVLDFGQSSAGLVLGTNLTASTQAFITLDDVTLTGTNYVSSRAVATRGATKRDATEPHLKVNGETVPFTREMEAATSQLTSDIETVTASVSAIASSISTITSNLSSYATISYVDAQIGAMLSSQL